MNKHMPSNTMEACTLMYAERRPFSVNFPIDSILNQNYCLNT